MADSAVDIRIGANTDGLRRGAKEARDHVDGLIGTLKAFKAEQVSEARTARFFASELAEIAPGADTAKRSIQGLINIGLSGGTLAMAFEGTLFVLRALKTEFDANKKAAEELKKIGVETAERIADAMKHVRESVMEALGPKRTDTEKAWQAALEPAHKELKKLQEEIDKTMQGKGGLRDWLAGAMGSARHMLGFQSTEEQTEGAAAKKGAIIGGIEAERPDMEKTAALESKKIRKEEALDLAKFRSDEMQEWHKHYDEKTAETLKAMQDQERFEKEHLTHVIKANYDAAEALKKFFHDQEEIRLKEYERRFEAMKKKITETLSKWSEYGAEVGSVFAGLITGTKSVEQAFASMAKLATKAIFEAVRMAIQAYALQAAAAAAAANASVPIFGFAIAAAAAAAMEALVMGLLDSMPSAAVGMPRVAADGPVYVHQNEAILTAREADTWRGGGSGGSHYHFHGTLIDAASVRRFVESREFQMAGREARRNGRWPG